MLIYFYSIPMELFLPCGASLDISGSFSATTSPSILFNNDFEFSATNSEAPPLLKLNITPGLQYETVSDSGYWLPTTALVKGVRGLFVCYVLGEAEKSNKSNHPIIRN